MKCNCTNDVVWGNEIVDEKYREKESECGLDEVLEKLGRRDMNG